MCVFFFLPGSCKRNRQRMGHGHGRLASFICPKRLYLFTVFVFGNNMERAERVASSRERTVIELKIMIFYVHSYK